MRPSHHRPHSNSADLPLMLLGHRMARIWKRKKRKKNSTVSFFLLLPRFPKGNQPQEQPSLFFSFFFVFSLFVFFSLGPSSKHIVALFHQGQFFQFFFQHWKKWIEKMEWKENEEEERKSRVARRRKSWRTMWCLEVSEVAGWEVEKSKKSKKKKKKCNGKKPRKAKKGTSLSSGFFSFSFWFLEHFSPSFCPPSVAWVLSSAFACAEEDSIVLWER